MKFRDLYPTLEQARYHVFSPRDLMALYSGEKAASLKKALSRWRKKGWVSLLRRGVYELAYPKDLLIPDLYIANRLYAPSYVSLETALSHYGIIPEVAMAVTSITVKATRRFKNAHGLFWYRTVQARSFAGYHIEKQNGFDILIADPEKALADYLHFKTYRDKRFDIAGERFDKDALSRLDKKKMAAYAKIYGIDMKGLYAHL